MTRDDIIRLARQAGLWVDNNGIVNGGDNAAGLLDFAAFVAKPLEEEIKRLRFCIPEGDAAAAMEYLAHCVEKAVAAEREACAKVCEDIAEQVTYQRNSQEAADRCADAIRARGIL